MGEKVLIRIDLVEAYKATLNDIEENLKQASEMWFSLTRLIITLSSSTLILSIALIDRIFPLEKSPVIIIIVLFISWLLIFIAILLGLAAEISGASFYKKLAINKEPSIKECIRNLHKGQFLIKEEDLDKKHIEDLPLIWGICEFILFALGIIGLCTYMIGNLVCKY